MHHLIRKSETPKNIIPATLSRRIVTQNHPYLKNNNQQQSPKSFSDLDLARIRKAVTAIAAKEEKTTLTTSEQQQQLEFSTPVKVEVVEQQQQPAAAHPIKPDPSSGVDTFIAIMVHASKCKSCPQLSCRKMRIVLQHYIRCGRLVAGETCQVCQQLLGIVTKHATQLCRVEQDQPCPVPLCDGLRRSGKLGLKEEEEMDFVFSA